MLREYRKDGAVGDLVEITQIWLADGPAAGSGCTEISNLYGSDQSAGSARVHIKMPGALQKWISWRPSALGHRDPGEARWIDRDMFGPQSLPRVRDVDPPVQRLDDRWIGVLARLAFEHQRRLPGLSVLRYRDVQRRPAVAGVVVNNELPVVGECHRIDP